MPKLDPRPENRRPARGLRHALALLALIATTLFGSTVAARSQGQVIVADIKGAIGVGTGHFVQDALTQAANEKAKLLILRMDTPGGLVSATRTIIQAILASPVPVATFVAPSGSRAASAGTYIAYASHVVGMAPGTHLGAATPVQMQMPGMPQSPKPGSGSKEESKDNSQSAMKNKIINDAIAYLRSLAQLRGRSTEWAEKFVRDAATLTSVEAAKEGVIDVVANDVRDLLDKIDGKEVKTQAGPVTLDVKDATVKTMEPTWKTKFLTTITDPNVAFILLLIGVYGIIFEFWSPGLTGPGVVGGICLIIALMALSALPLNAAGLALLALGIALMAAEAFAPGFGIMGIGGVVAFIAGAIFLFDPSGADIDLSIAWPLILAAAGTSALIMIGLLGFVVRERRREVVTGSEELLNLEGEVVSWDAGEGRVRVHGESWAARSDSDLAKGDQVRVAGREGLTLIVAKQ